MEMLRNEQNATLNQHYAMYGEPAAPPVDPYSDAYTQPPAPLPLERDLAPVRPGSRSPEGDANFHRTTPVPRSSQAPIAPNPSSVLGIFGLSIRTTERDLDDEFGRFGRVDKVVIVYDQRSGRSRGFGFITMATVEDAARCIKEMNGVELNGRRIRVDYSVTDRPHSATPGEYMGHRRRRPEDEQGGSSRGGGYRDRDNYRERDDYRGEYRSERRERSPRRGGGGGSERDRDYYGRDNRDWRDRRSPMPARGGGRGYSPEYRRRRSYSRSPPRGSSPRGARYEDIPSASIPPPTNGVDPRW